MNLVYIEHNSQSIPAFSRQKIFRLKLRVFSLTAAGKSFCEVSTGRIANTAAGNITASQNIHLAVIGECS